MKEFYCSTRVVSGVSAEKALANLGIRRLFLVTDPFFAGNGVAQRIGKGALAQATELFSKVAPDPTAQLAAEATAAAREFQPDTIVALGGGSAMDLAKAVSYFYEKPVRLIAIPTTSGSGSEVTDFAILTHNKVKHPLIDKKLCPEIAILDDSLVKGMPRGLAADTGFDVLTHAAESFVARGADGFSKALAKDAFRVVYSGLAASCGGDEDSRSRIHTASCMAGLAFSRSGLGLCHALSHALGGQFHVPHGRLNAILLPHVIRLNTHVAQQEYACLARAAGITGAADTVAARNLVGGLEQLARQLNMPKDLRSAGIDLAELRFHRASLVEAVLKDPCCEGNPMKIEPFMVEKILEAASRG